MPQRQLGTCSFVRGLKRLGQRERFTLVHGISAMVCLAGLVFSGFGGRQEPESSAVAMDTGMSGRRCVCVFGGRVFGWLREFVWLFSCLRLTSAQAFRAPFSLLDLTGATDSSHVLNTMSSQLSAVAVGQNETTARQLEQMQ